MLLYEKYFKHLAKINYANYRIVVATFQLKNTSKVYLISVYALGMSQPKEETDEFYQKLQNIVEDFQQLK